MAPLTSNLSKVISSDEANFSQADVGRSIVGEGIVSTIAQVNSPTEALMADFPAAPALNVKLYMADRPAGAGWCLYGDGKLEVNLGGIWRGEIDLAGFTVAADGTVTIGVGDSKMKANPDGSFTWGTGGAVVGITPSGQLFAGGMDYATAVFSVGNSGDLLVRETAQSMHSIPPGAIDWSAILDPTFDPPGGAFPSTADVAILDQTARVKIYYTTDGSDPTDTESATNKLYTGTRIHLTATTTIKAIAYIGPFKSGIASQTFTLAAGTVPNPQADPVGGTYTPTGGILNVEISDSLAGASIRYTIDGSTPSDTVGILISPANGSTAPSATIQLSTGTRTLKAIAYKAGKTNSGVVTNTYTITSGGSGTSGGGLGGGGRGLLP